jgi:curved DNA-binding protein CbpA
LDWVGSRQRASLDLELQTTVRSCRFERGSVVRDFYKVLGIAATADDRRIKTAFRRRAKAFHPDLHPGDSRAEERFKELTEAYEVLRSAQARATYDAYRARRRSAARRRVAGSAALMAASFVLTLGSAFAVLAVSDAGIPIRDGWQLPEFVASVVDRFARPGDSRADEWTKATSVAFANTSATDIAKNAPTAVGVRPGEAAEGRQRTEADGNAAAERAKTPPAQDKAEAPAQPKAQKKLAAASRAPRPVPSGAKRKEADLQSVVAIGDVSRTWPTADEPFMALGATGR